MRIPGHALEFLLIFNLQTTAFWAQEEIRNQPPDLPGYYEVTSRIGTGGQPTAAGFRSLTEKRYQAVVNLRTAGEAGVLGEEEKIVTDLGLRYYSFPVPGKAPQDQQALEFLKLMDGLEQEKVFVHCATANRVGSFVLIYRVLRDRIPQTQAEEEAGRIGLRSEVLLEFARGFIFRSAR